MKKAIFFLMMIISVFSIMKVNNIYSKLLEGPIITPYFGVGESSVDTNLGDGSDFSYRSGIQLMYGETDMYGIWGIGIDLGYAHLYESNVSGVKNNADYINTLLMGRLTFLYVTLKVGLGPYFSVGDINGTNLGAMLSGGLVLPLFVGKDGSGVVLPIMARGDWVFAAQTVSSISFFTGLSFWINM